MRSFLSITVLAIVLIFGAAANGQDMVTLDGVGTKSCGAWTAARRDRAKDAAWGYEQWLLGYLSGAESAAMALIPSTERTRWGMGLGQ
jgi:hypothetical protein